MTTLSRNICLALAGILMAATAQAAKTPTASQSCAPVCQPACEPVYAPSPCCPPTCNPSPYCGPNCIPAPYCGEINFRGEGLYWIAHLGGLESAFGSTTIATTVTPGVITTTVTEVDEEPDFEWRPGYRVGADMAFKCFTLGADWTHYNGRASFDKDNQNGEWKIRYDVIDVILGRRFCVAPCFYFKPFIGARGLKIHQTLQSHLDILFTAITGNNTVTSDMNDKEDFWGVGPELGIEGNWYMGGNLSLYGTFDVVTYYGEVKTENFDTDTFTITVSANNSRKKYGFNCLATDATIGFRWDKTWSQCNYDVLFMLKAGLEQHRIYDFSNLGKDGTLSLDGAVFGAGIGFRY